MSRFILILLALLFLAGCGGDSKALEEERARLAEERQKSARLQTTVDELQAKVSALEAELEKQKTIASKMVAERDEEKRKRDELMAKIDAAGGMAAVGVGSGEAAVKFTDLEGLAGENEITELAQLGIFGSSGGEFGPRRAITRGEFVAWLVTANNAYFPQGSDRFIALAGRDGPPGPPPGAAGPPPGGGGPPPGGPREGAGDGGPVEGRVEGRQGSLPADEEVALQAAFDPEEPAFTDVGPSSPWYAYVQGIMASGRDIRFGEKEFHPDGELTREEMIALKVTIDQDLSEKKPVSVEAVKKVWKWSDAGKINSRYLLPLYWDQFADHKNVTRIWGNLSELEPATKVSRAEAALCIWRIGDKPSRTARDVLKERG